MGPSLTRPATGTGRNRRARGRDVPTEYAREREEPLPRRTYVRGFVVAVATIGLLTGVTPWCPAETAAVELDTRRAGELVITVGGTPVAVYIFEDLEGRVTRPFFAKVRAPGGSQVTRNHPPVEGQDLTDHADLHPGIWLSFGDISASDYWRGRARVRQVSLVRQPSAAPGRGSFAVRNRYFDQHDSSRVVCEERCCFTFLVRPHGYCLLWDSVFASDQEFTFGDQEEMGLGLRIATPLRVERHSRQEPDVPPGNGTILDAAGRQNEKEIWGHAADWCDYSGISHGQQVGITLFCHPGNFRSSWFHVRDYGLLVANPFGREAMGHGPASKIVVKPGQELRLRYGLLIHSGPQGHFPDLAAAYADYLQLAKVH